MIVLVNLIKNIFLMKIMIPVYQITIQEYNVIKKLDCAAIGNKINKKSRNILWVRK